MEQLIRNFPKIFYLVSAIGLLVIIISKRKKIKTFILEVKTELTKVSWSTRQELIGSTFVVIVITLILAVFIGIMDLLLSKILSLVFK